MIVYIPGGGWYHHFCFIKTFEVGNTGKLFRVAAGYADPLLRVLNLLHNLLKRGPILHLLFLPAVYECHLPAHHTE